MGYYVINNLIKERINNMSKETMRETINTITHLDSMKAVKVAFDLSSTTMDSVTKVTQVIDLIDNNLKSLAIKVVFEPKNVTLKDQDIENFCNDIVFSLKSLGGSLRS